MRFLLFPLTLAYLILYAAQYTSDKDPTTMKAVYIEQTGGVEALTYGDQPKPEPGPGEALIKVAASGVNFIDTYHRSGLYKLPLPAIIGSEAAGTVEESAKASPDSRPAITSPTPWQEVPTPNINPSPQGFSCTYPKVCPCSMQRP